MRRDSRNNRNDLENWRPVTKIGKKVQAGEITDVNFLLDTNAKIREHQITETLIPNLTTDLLLVGQAKGKFGGGQRRVFRVTQKKTRDGNKPKFLCMAVVGNNNGIIGMGVGHAGETVPARNKSFKNAKKNIFKIKRGCGSWECGCGQPHSIPFAVTGKSSSVSITLLPAPKGIGLCVNDECKKILKVAGIKDVWSKTKGQTGSRMNLIKACMKALRKLNKYRLNPKYASNVSIIEGEDK